jgi:hypothetical protein
MGNHRVLAKLDAAVDTYPFRAWGGADERHTGVVAMLFDAFESPEKIEMPPRAPQLAVGDRFEPEVFLALDDALDFGIFDPRQRDAVDLAERVLRARRFESFGTEQAADVIGTKWWLRSSDLSILLY